MSSNASEVVVLGHSFIERLEMYAHLEWENLNVDPSRVIVHFKGVYGGNFRQFCSKELTDCLKTIIRSRDMKTSSTRSVQ